MNQSKAEIRRQRMLQEENRRKYEKANASACKIFIAIFGGTLLFALVSLIIMLATDTVFIHNSGMTENGGREVSVSGAAFLKALFTNNYSSSAAGYDDIAVPFYYYAKNLCLPAAVFTLVTLAAQILAVAFSGFALFAAIRKKDYRFSLLTLGASAITAIFSVALYAICISMSGSKILPVYCNGNPACSIQSDMIWGVLLSLVMLAGNIYAVIRFAKLKKMEKLA